MHVEKPEEMVPYLGNAVPRRGFRAYIYHADGRTRLVNSYDEFDALIHSDGWYASKDETQGQKEVATEAPKKQSKKPGA